MKQHVFAAALVAAVSAYGSALAAATIVAPGTSEDSVNKSLTVGAGTEVKDVETVNGSIDVQDQSSAQEVSTVNGSIDVGNNVSVSTLETVNGNKSWHPGTGHHRTRITGPLPTSASRWPPGARAVQYFQLQAWHSILEWPPVPRHRHPPC